MLRLFHDLVGEHQHRVFTFACYYLGDREEAEDVTQEVLLRLWRNIDRVDPGMAGAWLLKVTRNACLDALRSRKSRRRLFVAGLDETAAESADPDDRTEAALLSWDVQRHLRRAVAALEDPYRTIAILREVQGKSYQEIAATLDMPLNTVKTYLHRARRKLREGMREVSCHAASS